MTEKTFIDKYPEFKSRIEYYDDDKIHLKELESILDKHFMTKEKAGSMTQLVVEKTLKGYKRKVKDAINKIFDINDEEDKVHNYMIKEELELI
jgi:hypothetical protein